MDSAQQRLEHMLAWMDSEVGVHTSYHNHKEGMAWGATIAFLVIVALADRVALSLRGWPSRSLMSLVVTLVAYFAFVFIHFQFEARWRAADRVVAFRRVRAKLVQRQAVSDEDLILRSPPPEEQGLGVGIWPSIVEKELALCATPRRPQLFGAVKTLSVPWRFHRAPSRSRSELPSYGVLIVASLLALAIIWLQPARDKTPEITIQAETQDRHETTSPASAKDPPENLLPADRDPAPMSDSTQLPTSRTK